MQKQSGNAVGNCQNLSPCAKVLWNDREANIKCRYRFSMQEMLLNINEW